MLLQMKIKNGEGFQDKGEKGRVGQGAKKKCTTSQNNKK